METIYISKVSHKGVTRIKLDFGASPTIKLAIKKIPSCRYSRTLNAWHISYDSASYRTLKQLGHKIIIDHQTGTTATREITGIESSNTVLSPTSTKGDAAIPCEGLSIVMNNRVFQLTIPYNEADTTFIKTLEKAYWNANFQVWIIKASIKNLRALQDRFRLWSAVSYEKHFGLISAVENPQKLILFTTPEHKNKIALKLEGYQADIHFVKQIPDRYYDKDYKRWLIPNEAVLLQRIIDHYQQLGVKIINRIPKGSTTYTKQKKSHGERQYLLLKKFDPIYHPLLKLYTDTIIAQRYSLRTLESYTRAFYQFASAIGVDQVPYATEQDVTSYMASIAANKVADSTINRIFSAIKFYYSKVIFRPDFELERLKRPRKGRFLPTILSTQEVKRLFKTVENLKHKTLLYAVYSAGLRLNEVLSLRVQDFQWDRNQIFIKAGKGKKDRIVPLSEHLKSALLRYIDQYKPIYWLFEGQSQKYQYSSSSLQKIVKNAARNAGINKKVTPHTLRHCYATHLMDNGVAIRYIQELLGHKDIKTTLIYTHVTTNGTSQITSPLDNMNFDSET